MALSLDDIAHLAQLARIALTKTELKDLQNELTPILALVEKMQATDTKNILPMAHAQDIAQRLREDEVIAPDLRESFLPLAPQTEDHLFLVPKVIE